MKLKISHAIGRETSNPYFEDNPWVLPPFFKGFSFLNCFVADKDVPLTELHERNVAKQGKKLAVREKYIWVKMF